MSRQAGSLGQNESQLPVHLLVCLGDFRVQAFSSSKLASHYARHLLSTSPSHDSASSGPLDSTICLQSHDTNQTQCFYRKVTKYKVDYLSPCLKYTNIVQLDIVSTRMDTILTVKLINHCESTLVSLSVVYSKEPDNLDQLFEQISSCSQLKHLTFEILNSSQFVSLHRRIPTSIGNVDSVHLTFPILTIELIGLLNSLNSASITLNTSGHFDLPPLQTNLSPTAKAKILGLPLIHPRIGAVPNLVDNFRNLRELSIDCLVFVEPDTINPLLSHLSSLAHLESLVFANVSLRSLLLTKPCTVAKIGSVRNVTIRFAVGLVSVGHDVFITELWTVLSTTKLVTIQKMPSRCVEMCRRPVVCQEHHLLTIRQQLTGCDVIIEE